MQFARYTLDDCAAASGVVVVIDVIRAFTTAAFAFGAGAGRILLVEGVEEALALRGRFPGAVVMGEVGGRRPPGFDLGNSPAALRSLHYAGTPFIQRTSAGTQGVVRVFSSPASPLTPALSLAQHPFGAQGRGSQKWVLAASFPVASATAALIRRLQPFQVSFVITGIFPGGLGDEDAALADYLERLLGPDPVPDSAPYLQRVRESVSGRRLFNDPADPDFSPADLDCCTDLDRFPFALPVRRENDLLIMEKENSEQ